MIFKKHLLLLLILFFSGLSFAQTDNDETVEEKPVDPQLVIQVENLINDINERKSTIRSLEKSLKKASLDLEKDSLSAEIKQENERLQEQTSLLEQLATGEVDLSPFQETEQDEFSWQDELKDIFKPLIFELKALTEKPRQIERLRSRLAILKAQLISAEAAVSEIDTLLVDIKGSKTQKSLQKLLDNWVGKRDDIHNEIQLLELQLSEQLDNGNTASSGVFNSIKAFFTGRGLNLLLSILVFVVTLLVLRFVGRRLERLIGRGQDKERRFFARVLHIVFEVLAVLIAMCALLATLYSQGDWLMLTLLLIVLVGLAFALRNSLPRYVDEVRLLLNLGAAREGERVIYNNLAWKISRLNIYSDLVNPVLTGGRIRLPMHEMLGLVSRRWSKNEPWFPSKPGDFLILNDETYGEVILQTPEVVQMRTYGGSIQNYATSDFLGMQPRNLTEEGFGIFVDFGLDYSEQENITGSVLEVFRESLKSRLMSTDYAEHIHLIKVEFKEAAASSLNFKIIVLVKGEGANSYYSVKRYLQTAAVDVCNEQGWSIPFNQLTVHMNQ